MGQKVENSDYEIRKLPPSALKELVAILEISDSWKELMCIIPDSVCDSKTKYTAEHIRMIEAASQSQKRECADIFLDEWGTSGEIRPTLSTLLDLLQKAQLFRAADFVSQNLLKRDTSVPRPAEGPAAKVPIPEDVSVESYETDNECGLMKVPYSEIVRCSKNFSVCLGKGAFGSVYWCNLPSGVRAVKCLHSETMSSISEPLRQLTNEISALTKYRHQNLLPLLGYSYGGPEVCLLYEYMPHGSLQDKLLFSKETLDWDIRLKICVGTAEGLAYLHCAKEPMIHRDVKTANILLSEDLTPKLGDFGLARVCLTNTLVTSTIVGTSPYMSPEALRGTVSLGMDVFSYGVVLLEVITGLPVVDESREYPDLVSHVDDIDNIETILDNSAGEINLRIALGLYEISQQCHKDVKTRASMETVLKLIREL